MFLFFPAKGLKRVSCFACDKEYPTNDLLKTHIESAHLQPQFICESGHTRTFQSRTAFHRHLRQVHSFLTPSEDVKLQEYIKLCREAAFIKLDPDLKAKFTAWNNGT